MKFPDLIQNMLSLRMGLKQVEQKSTKNNFSSHTVEAVLLILPLLCLYFFCRNITLDRPDQLWFIGPIILSISALLISLKKPISTISIPIVPFLFVLTIIITTYLNGRVNFTNWNLLSLINIFLYSIAICSFFPFSKFVINTYRASIIIVFSEFIFLIVNFNYFSFFGYGGISNSSIFLGETQAIIFFIISFYHKKIDNKFYKIVNIFIGLISLLLILVSSSRTAYLSIVLAFLFIFLSERKFIMLNIFLVLISLLLLFYFKKDSSYGRMLIIKVAALNFNKYFPLPLGTGSVSTDYLKWQNDYFKKGEYSIEEEQLADNVYFVYNDFFKIFIENGLIGLILFAFPIIKIASNKGSPFVLIYLLVFYLQCLLSNPTNTSIHLVLYFISSISLFKNQKKITIKKILLSTICAYILIWILTLFTGYFIWNKAQQLVTERYGEKKNELYFKAYKALDTNGPFLLDYSDYLNKCNKLDSSLLMYNKANKFLYSSNLYSNIGNLFFLKKDYTKAIEFYTLSHNTVPNRFYPLFMILRCYIAKGDKLNSKLMAKVIYEKKVKVPSPIIEQIKYFAFKNL